MVGEQSYPICSYFSKQIFLWDNLTGNNDCTNGLNEIGYIYQSDLKLFLHVILCHLIM